MKPGLHLVTNGPANDPADPRQARADVHGQCAGGRAIVSDQRAGVSAGRVRRERPDDRHSPARRGTVSSTVLAVTDEPGQAVYEFAQGVPDVTPYDYYSDVLRGLLSGAVR